MTSAQDWEKLFPFWRWFGLNLEDKYIRQIMNETMQKVPSQATRRKPWRF